MDKEALVSLLRESADIFKPLSSGKLRQVAKGDAFKLGRDYTEPEPYALAWACMLTEIAAMIEYQDSPVNDKQMHHIKQLLGVFGGNGSLDDLCFSSKLYESESKLVNDKLRERVGLLRKVFGESP